MFTRRMEGVSINTMENDEGSGKVSMTQERREYAGRFETKILGTNHSGRYGVPRSCANLSVMNFTERSAVSTVNVDGEKVKVTTSGHERERRCCDHPNSRPPVPQPLPPPRRRKRE
jgi:hypothetical protein